MCTVFGEPSGENFEMIVTQLIDEFLERRRQDSTLTIDTFVQDHPRYADILHRELSEELAWVEGGRQVRDSIQIESSEETLKRRWEDLRSVLSSRCKSVDGQTIQQIVGKGLDDDRRAKLVGMLESIVDPGFVALHQSLRELLQNMRRDIEVAFAPVTPSLGALFGESVVDIISPFGKVRYPVVFECRVPVKSTAQEITIDGTPFVRRTSEPHFEVSTENVVLQAGEEYMWTWQFSEGDKVIEEATGFFSMATAAELTLLREFEARVARVQPLEDRETLFGLFLESAGFLMEAVQKYQHSYRILKTPALAYRIASCYDKLELMALRDEWNRKIPSSGEEMQ